MSPIVHFIVFLSVAFVVYWFVCPVKWHSKFLLLASLYVLSLFSIKYTLFLFLSAVLVYMAGNSMANEAKNRTSLLKLTLFWLIGTLCFFKYIHLILDPLSKLGFPLPFDLGTTFELVVPVGMSYVVFRLLHYIVEVYRKSLPGHTFYDFALYVFFFPTYVAGPVDRFQRFQPQTIENRPFSFSDVNYGLFRIISGILKKFFIADKLLFPLVMPILNTPGEHSRIIVLLAIYGMALRIYMDFSGYTDIALGVSRLFGYKIMENFNWPYFKNNIAMFWRSWHISVYNFIRDYFFFPVFGFRASQLKIYTGLVLTMVVFCVWHEGTLPFLLLGLYHGFGLVGWQLFQELKGKYRNLRKIVDSPFLDPVSVFITFNFVSFGFVLFFLDIKGINAVLSKIFSV